MPLPGDDGVPVGSFERRIGKTPAKNKKSKKNKAHTLPPAPPATVENEADPVQEFETGADGLQAEEGVEVEAARQVAGDVTPRLPMSRADSTLKSWLKTRPVKDETRPPTARRRSMGTRSEAVGRGAEVLLRMPPSLLCAGREAMESRQRIKSRNFAVESRGPPANQKGRPPNSSAEAGLGQLTPSELRRRIKGFEERRMKLCRWRRRRRRVFGVGPEAKWLAARGASAD
jgi:hypothetical protein